MATINAVEAIFVKGIFVLSSSDYSMFTRAGVEGTGILLGVKHDQVQNLTTEYFYDTQENAESAESGYRALEGTNVTIVDQFGTTFTNATICRVVTRIMECVHPDTPWLLVGEWDIVLET